MMLWKAADHQAPPGESADITKFGWEIHDSVPIPIIAKGDPAPPELIDVIRCQCRAQDKKCITEACGCHKEHLSCTSYCNCSGEDGCCNPYTNRHVLSTDGEEAFQDDVDQEDGVDQDIREENYDEGADQGGEGHEDVLGDLFNPNCEWEHSTDVII